MRNLKTAFSAPEYALVALSLHPAAVLTVLWLLQFARCAQDTMSRML